MSRRVTPLGEDHSRPAHPTRIASESTSFIYEATLLKPLPVVDLSRTLLTKCLSPQTEYRVVTFIATHTNHLTNVFWLGMISFIVSFFYNIEAVRTCLLVFVLPTSVGHICALLLLPLDLVAVLLKNYEFWFVTSFNIAHWVVVGVILDDTRAVMCVPAFLGYQLAILIDANIRLSQTTLSSMKISIPFLLITGALVSLRYVEGMNHFAMVVHDQERFDASDVIYVTTSTLLVFLVKILVKKKKRAHPGPPGFLVMSCAVLSATLQLTRTNTASTPAQLIRAQTKRSLTAVRYSGVLQSHRQPITIHAFPIYHVDPEDTVLPSRLRRHVPGWLQRPCWLRATQGVFHAVGGLSYAMLAANSVLSKPEGLPPMAKLCASIGAACTITFCLSSFVFYQRELLFVVVMNFDFWFSSAQVVMFAVSLCDMILWDGYRSMVVFMWTLLFHWAITLDALTPVVKQDVLRFSKRWAAPTLVAMVVVGFIIFSRLVLSADTDLNYHDRTLWRHRLSASQVISLRTKSIVLGRILTIVLWTARKVYLVLVRHEDELNIVKGVVEYLSPYAVFPIAKGTTTTSQRTPGLYRLADITDIARGASLARDASDPRSDEISQEVVSQCDANDGDTSNKGGNQNE